MMLPDYARRSDDAAGGSARHTHIIHFAWSHSADSYVADHFDSDTDFRPSQTAGAAFNINPRPSRELGALDAFNAEYDDAALLQTFRLVQQEQNNLPPAERTPLGGAVSLIEMRDARISINPAWGTLDTTARPMGAE